MSKAYRGKKGKTGEKHATDIPVFVYSCLPEFISENPCTSVAKPLASRCSLRQSFFYERTQFARNPFSAKPLMHNSKPISNPNEPNSAGHSRQARQYASQLQRPSSTAILCGKKNKRSQYVRRCGRKKMQDGLLSILQTIVNPAAASAASAYFIFAL